MLESFSNLALAAQSVCSCPTDKIIETELLEKRNKKYKATERKNDEKEKDSDTERGIQTERKVVRLLCYFPDDLSPPM